MSKQRADLVLVNKWLMHIKDIYRLLPGRDRSLARTTRKRANRLVELNIIEQVRNLTHTSIIQQAWREEDRPILHGWVYGLEDGKIKQLIMLPPG